MIFPLFPYLPPPPLFAAILELTICNHHVLQLAMPLIHRMAIAIAIASCDDHGHAGLLTGWLAG